MLSSSQELLIVSVELKGIIMSNHKNKVFDNFAYNFLGLSRIMDGQIDARGYAKLTDLDGDFVFTETMNAPCLLLKYCRSVKKVRLWLFLLM
jgi:hypothetical protein